MQANDKIEIYSNDGRDIEVRLDLRGDTLWLSQAQMAELFDKDVRTINEHIKTIFAEGELVESDSTIRKFRIVETERFRATVKNYLAA